MRVQRIVGEVWKNCAAEIHASRLESIKAAVEGLSWGGRLSLTGLGRAVRGPTAAKHSIKRIDRLLSNSRLWLERNVVFAALARFLLRGVARPVIAVDWTQLVNGFHALVAAVPLFGRAIPIYIEVHPEKLLGNPSIEEGFLGTLKTVVPAGCRPIIVTDAGYRTPFFKSVLCMGWDFLGRIRGAMTMHPVEKKEVTNARELCGKATARPKCLGVHKLCLRGDFTARLVLARNPKKTRRRCTRELRTRAQRKAAQGWREPWLLVTSLPLAAKKIVRLYAQRMQIEETFRDTKNSRWGWSFRQARCGNAQRTTILLLIGALTAAAMTLLGHSIEARGWHRRYQANTVKTRALSLFTLATQVVRSGRRIPIPIAEIRAGLRDVRESLRAAVA